MFHLPPLTGWIAPRLARAAQFIPSILFLLPFSQSTASVIYWGSEAFADHRDSKGTAWTPEFTLTLGVFRGGFLPSPENQDDWLENFHPLSTATFDHQEKRYAGAADLAQNLPAGFSGTAHIWAKNRDEITTGPEWLLLTSASWKWTATPATRLALPSTWITSQSTTWILGSPTTTLPVRPTVIPPRTWLTNHFPGEPGKADPLADPDRDGIPNATEYLLGTDPSKANSADHHLSLSGNNITVRLDRNPYARSDFALETSTDLSDWKTVTALPSADRPDLLEYQLPTDTRPGPRFFRFNLNASFPPTE